MKLILHLKISFLKNHKIWQKAVENNEVCQIKNNIIKNYIKNSKAVTITKYEYDAWGNVQSITDQNGNAITSETYIGNLNPFRYRGYYYDTESGFYYLMSRYYDPVTHRFINADGYFRSGGDILDANMSAYCANNPIMNWDPTGTEVRCNIHQSYYVPTCLICSPSRRRFVEDRYDWIKSVNPQFTLEIAPVEKKFSRGGITVEPYQRYSISKGGNNSKNTTELTFPDISVATHTKIMGYDFSTVIDNTGILYSMLGATYENVANSVGFGYGKDADHVCWDITTDLGDGWYYSTGYTISMSHDTKEAIGKGLATAGVLAIGVILTVATGGASAGVPVFA